MAHSSRGATRSVQAEQTKNDDDDDDRTDDVEDRVHGPNLLRCSLKQDMCHPIHSPARQVVTGPSRPCPTLRVDASPEAVYDSPQRQIGPAVRRTARLAEGGAW